MKFSLHRSHRLEKANSGGKKNVDSTKATAAERKTQDVPIGPTLDVTQSLATATGYRATDAMLNDPTLGAEDDISSFDFGEWFNYDPLEPSEQTQTWPFIDDCVQGDVGFPHTSTSNASHIESDTAPVPPAVPETVQTDNHGKLTCPDFARMYDAFRKWQSLPNDGHAARIYFLPIYNAVKEHERAVRELHDDLIRAPAGHELPLVPGIYQNLNTVMESFNELRDTEELVLEMRRSLVVDFRIDPEQGPDSPSLVDQETSDSYDSDAVYETVAPLKRKLLHSFQNDSTKDSALIGPIEQARLRRDIRAWARLMNYGCMTLTCKTMLLHKDRSKIPRRRRRRDKTEGNHLFSPPSSGLTAEDWLPCTTRRFDLMAEHPLRNANVTFTAWMEERRAREKAERPRRPRERSGYSSANSGHSDASIWTQASARSRKRRRNSRDLGGYVCSEPLCLETFDRQCDLTHHERSHLPYDQRPYPCEKCEKRFLYPKDLRRHEKTHSNAASESAGG